MRSARSESSSKPRGGRARSSGSNASTRPRAPTCFARSAALRARVERISTTKTFTAISSPRGSPRARSTFRTCPGPRSTPRRISRTRASSFEKGGSICVAADAPRGGIRVADRRAASRPRITAHRLISPTLWRWKPPFREGRWVWGEVLLLCVTVNQKRHENGTQVHEVEKELPHLPPSCYMRRGAHLRRPRLERHRMIDRQESRPPRAVILAAGTGSRLVAQDAFPKPLKVVAGVALLVRVLRTVQGEGIREAVIVIGYRGEQIRKALLAEPSLGMKLHFVENDRFDRKNGVSLLAARNFIDQECILSIADHLYSPEAVRRLMKFDLPKGACALGVDYDIERCFDLDDATKVRLENGKIVDIGKEIADYNCIDTGVFRIGPELVRELERVEKGAGDCSLSDGVRALGDRGKFFGCDVGDSRWIDVDTPEAFLRAEAMVRVFGDSLGDEPASAGGFDGEGMELFAPTWVRAAQPYREDHFNVASSPDGLVRMMSNESPFSPSTPVIDAIVKPAPQGNIYPTGGVDLRRRLGVRDGLDEGHVVLGAGSTELIDLVIRTVVAPGEAVLLSVPTFSMYEARARVCGGIPTFVPMTDDHDFDVGGIVSAVAQPPQSVFLLKPE